MAKQRIILFTILLLLSSCSMAIDIGPAMDSINNRPFASDSIPDTKYQKIKLQPLTEVDINKPDTLIKRHKQHKVDRDTVRQLDKAIEQYTIAQTNIKHAMRAIEEESRANERMLVRTEASLETERRNARFNDILHRITEVLLITALVIVGL